MIIEINKSKYLVEFNYFLKLFNLREICAFIRFSCFFSFFFVILVQKKKLNSDFSDVCAEFFILIETFFNLHFVFLFSPFLSVFYIIL